jgi:hypothetical protein
MDLPFSARSKALTVVEVLPFSTISILEGAVETDRI